MKIVVQIPCFNEEASLPRVLDDIRENFKGGEDFSVEILIIDDGSTDKTLEAAKKSGAKEAVILKQHSGLGVAFKQGLKKAVSLGAEIIINTDGDFQYLASDMRALVQPILDRQADMVIGDRQIARLSKYPGYKRVSQAGGNFLVSKLFKTVVKDSTSGFRAISRSAAITLIDNLENNYTYTLESICILMKNNLRIIFVPISIRTALRQSRLIKNKLYYVFNYIFTALKYFSR